MASEFLLVDGYNIIFAWDILKNLVADLSLDAARIKLAEILCNYQGLINSTVILVFDAYNVKGGTEKVEAFNNITIIYTKEAETADCYIERTTSKLTKVGKVSVATSDLVEQVIILGKGAYRISADVLLRNIREAEEKMRKSISDAKPIKKNSLMSNLDHKTIELLEQMRRKT